MKSIKNTALILMMILSVNTYAEQISDSVFSGLDSRELLDNIKPGLISEWANYGYARHIGKTISMTGNIGNDTNTISDYTQFQVSAIVNGEGNVFLKGGCSTQNLSAFDYSSNNTINGQASTFIDTGTTRSLVINNYINTEILTMQPVCDFKVSPAGLSVITKDAGSKVFFTGFAQWPQSDKTLTTYSKNNRNNAVVTYQ